MADPKIDIGSYAGHKDEESPRVFFVHGEKITVLKILRNWIEEEERDSKQKKFFAVKGSDSFIHTSITTRSRRDGFTGTSSGTSTG